MTKETYYSKNKEKINARVKAYRKANPEKVQKWGMEYRKTHKNDIMSRDRAYRESHQDRIKSSNKHSYEKNCEQRKARSVAYRKDNPDRVKKWNCERYSSAERRAATLETTRRWAKENPDRYAGIVNRSQIRHRLKKRGLTLETFDAMLMSQNYCCAICKGNTTGNKRNGKHGAKRRLENGWPSTAQSGDFTWHIDHDHKTGKVRGLLCHPCNAALGLVKDSKKTLSAMIKYLENSRYANQGSAVER